MKALIVSPYFDHLGGGERYMLTLASVLETLGYSVTYGWDNPDSIVAIAKLLNLSLKPPVCDPHLKSLYHSHNPLAMYYSTRAYDLVVYLSDGSIPLLGGRRNLLHMQVPFHQVGGKNWKNQLKKRSIDQVIVNSQFTKRIVDREYGINSIVLYPPVPLNTPSTTKDDLILSVGRFDPSLNVKKHDVLIDAFKLLSPKLPSYRLVLAGGSSNDAWISELNQKAATYPIDILPNISYIDLLDLYRRAKFYWHAAGYGVDEDKNPELTEHFGITTVEAISSGAIPLVVGKGGQTEIVSNPNLLWETASELVEKTLSLVSNPTPPNLDLSAYSLPAFKDKLEKILQ